MKTFLVPFVFAAVLLGFTVSASADVATLDWDNPGSAIVFAQEITNLHNDDNRGVTIDYALKDNILYSRVQLDPNQYTGGDFEFMTSLGLTNMRFFGGNESAYESDNINSEGFTGKRKNFMPDGSIWEAFKAAANNDGAITATFSSFTLLDYDDDETTQKNAFFDSTRLDSSIYDFNQYYKDSINDLYYDTAGEGEFMEGPVTGFERAAAAVFAVDEDGNVVYRKNAATDDIPFYGAEEELNGIGDLGMTTNYTYNYVDGWLQVFGDNDFLFMVNSDPTTGTIQYAINLSSLGLENYSGIHIASEIEDYYTYLSLPPAVTGTPEPATVLILGFAGCFVFPFLRRKKLVK